MAVISRLAFFGTPTFALPTLEALAAAGRVPRVVVSQPGRGAGRGRRPQQPPVALWAEDHGIELLQPERVRDEGFLCDMADRELDVAVVVAFGQIFPKRLLEMPRWGCINLHASLLPAYRGASPIAAAILAGEQTTGVTTMRMEAGLDTGPILLQAEAPIEEGQTTAELEVRLAALGAELMVETLEGLEKGTVTAKTQDESRASYAPRLTRQDGLVEWRSSARDVSNQLRAVTPWPGLHAMLGGKPIKVLRGRPLEAERQRQAVPGEFLGLVDGCLAVVCSRGIFGIERLQRPGRRPVTAVDFQNGERLAPGDRFEDGELP